MSIEQDNEAIIKQDDNRVSIPRQDHTEVKKPIAGYCLGWDDNKVYNLGWDNKGGIKSVVGAYIRR